MSSNSVLNRTGLTYLWSKISAYFSNALAKIGNEDMGTTASTVTGAIAEHSQELSELNSNNKWKYTKVSNVNYGEALIFYNLATKTGIVRWMGNGTAPPNQIVECTIPDNLIPIINVAAPMRNGSHMEIRTDKKLNLVLTGVTWSNGEVVYPLA